MKQRRVFNNQRKWGAYGGSEQNQICSQFCPGSAGTWTSLLCSQGSEIHTPSYVSHGLLQERLAICDSLLRIVVPVLAGISVAVCPKSQHSLQSLVLDANTWELGSGPLCLWVRAAKSC